MPHQRTKLRNVSVERSRHGKIRFYYRRGKGRRVRLPDDIRSDAFMTAYRSADGGEPLPPIDPMAKQRKQATEKAMKVAIKSAKHRAAAKGLPFDIDVDYLLTKAEAQGFRCELTGVPFYSTPRIRGSWRVNPYAPSLDRVVPRLGYTRGNVRIVIFAVNAMVLDWGEELFLRVVGSYRYHRAKRERKPRTDGNPQPRT